MTTPDLEERVIGSDTEWTRLTNRLLQAGTFVRLDKSRKPNSFYAASDPTEVARVDERTYICSVDAARTNNWMGPEEMKDLMRGLCAGCMTGLTMFGENSRVLKWAIERIEGKPAAVETPDRLRSQPALPGDHGPRPERRRARGRPRGRRRGVEGGDPADRGVVRQVRRHLPIQLRIGLDGLKARRGVE